MSPGRWPKYAVCTRRRLPCEDRSTASGPAAGASAATCRRHQSANPQRPGSSRAWAASTAQSAHSSPGLGFCRHSTAISWHNTSGSASLMLPSVQAAPSSRLDAGTPDRSSVPSRTSDPARHGCSPPANQQVSRLRAVLEPHSRAGKPVMVGEGTAVSGGSPLAACGRLGRGVCRGGLALERHAAG